MLYFEDCKTGMKFNLGTQPVKKEEMLEYAHKYNRSPLHLDEGYMKNSMYGGIIAPGMFSFSLPWAAFIDRNIFGEAEIGGKSTKVDWYKAVYAGDILSSEAEITALNAINSGKGVVTVEITSWNQDGKMVMKSINEIILKRKAE